jgi:hypothetical protein
MHRQSGKNYPLMQKSLQLPNSMQPIYYSTLIWPKWRTGNALHFHSSSITKSRFGCTTSYKAPNEQTSDHAKMIYLQNAVYAVEELRLVQTTGSQLALANGTVPTYKDYEALLKSAASTYN